jgi:hypothetical protein
MANYKLSNDNFWETSGVFDVAQNKTQREINKTASKAQDTTTVSGAIATFDDGVEGVPIKNLTVNINAVQSGTGNPSPTNVRPITGWTGANVYRSDADTTNPTTYSITFPSEAGIVYGGSLKYNGDGTWNLTKTCYGYSLDTEDRITAHTLITGRNNSYRMQIRTTTILIPRTRTIQKCSHAIYESDGGNVNSNASNACFVVYPSDNRIFFALPNVTTLDGYRTFFRAELANGTPVTFMSSVSNPETFTFTTSELIKTLAGVNNIWADCGNVTVEYGAYIATIENQLGEKIPKLMFALVEKTTTASQAYSVNDFFIMGDTLYKVTASIASGGTITPNTNCTATTIGAIITSLLNA